MLRVPRYEPVEKVRADEAGAAGDENIHCGLGSAWYESTIVLEKAWSI
jgi:hypothetical protein